MRRTRLHDWLWDNQMRQMPRALVGLVWAGWACVAIGVVYLAIQTVRGA